MIAGFELLDREAPPTLDVGRRTGIAEVETGYGEAEARRQAARCLVCHVQTIYDPEKCVLCSRCVDVCPEYCLALVPFDELDLAEPSSATRSRRAAEAGGLPLVRDGQGRRALHPLRAVRDPLPDRRHDDGAVHDHRAVRRAAAQPDAEEVRMSDDEHRQTGAISCSKLGHRRRRRGARRPGGRVAALAVPNVSYDAPTTVKLGLPADFPDGLKFLPDERLFVFREGNTFHAISAVCTHLGCTVRAEALSQPETADGGRRAAAADAPLPLPLPRLEVHGRRHERRRARRPSRSPGTTCRVAPDDGQLVVDLARRGRPRLPPDARLRRPP